MKRATRKASSAASAAIRASSETSKVLHAVMPQCATSSRPTKARKFKKIVVQSEEDSDDEGSDAMGDEQCDPKPARKGLTHPGLPKVTCTVHLASGSTPQEIEDMKKVVLHSCMFKSCNLHCHMQMQSKQKRREQQITVQNNFGATLFFLAFSMFAFMLFAAHDLMKVCNALLLGLWLEHCVDPVERAQICPVPCMFIPCFHCYDFTVFCSYFGLSLGSH